MHPARRLYLLLNLVGGPAVLGSYAWGIATHDEPGKTLWGQVPVAIVPLYNLSMLGAAVGYLLFAWFLFFRVDPATATVGARGYGVFNALTALALAPSALWMPLTFAHAAHPGPLAWAAVRAVLFLVGAGALGMIVALARLRPVRAPWAHRLALVGAVAFAFQTAVLDALVWPAYFRG